MVKLFKHFSYRPGILWDDAQYYGADRYLNGYAWLFLRVGGTSTEVKLNRRWSYGIDK